MIRLIILILLLASLNGIGQNAKPSVAAGNNVTITLPTSTVSLVGKACDADGSISTYRWTGNAGAITSPNSASTTVTGLSAAGNYVFKLKATDNSGLTDSSSITVVVNPALPPTNNKAPRSYAGTDMDIVLPANSVSLTGKGTDADGLVVAFLWTKETGPGGNFANANAASTTFSGLTAGDYRLKLSVTDNNGAIGTDTVHITVRGANPPPPPPGGDTTGPPQGYTLVFSTGYDKISDINFNGNSEQWGNPDNDRVENHLSTTIFKTGPGSFKSVPSEVSAGIRSEVQYGSAQTPLEGIVEYDVYYDNFFANSGHSLQWHPSTSGGSGTGLYHKNGQLQFVTVKSGQTGTNVGAPFSVSTKVWHHIKLTYKFGSSGYIKVELDGVEKVNANVQMGDGSDPYLKVGVNMWVNQASIVYYDNLKVYKKG